MDLRAPLSFGGAFYLTSVTVGRDPDDDRVHDCAGCDGHVFRDRFHLTATVVGDRGRETGADGGDAGGTTTRRERYHYCSDDCLRSWVSVAVE